MELIALKAQNRKKQEAINKLKPKLALPTEFFDIFPADVACLIIEKVLQGEAQAAGHGRNPKEPGWLYDESFIQSLEKPLPADKRISVPRLILSGGESDRAIRLLNRLIDVDSLEIGTVKCGDFPPSINVTTILRDVSWIGNLQKLHVSSLIMSERIQLSALTALKSIRDLRLGCIPYGYWDLMSTNEKKKPWNTDDAGPHLATLTTLTRLRIGTDFYEWCNPEPVPCLALPSSLEELHVQVEVLYDTKSVTVDLAKDLPKLRVLTLRVQKEGLDISLCGPSTKSFALTLGPSFKTLKALETLTVRERYICSDKNGFSVRGSLVGLSNLDRARIDGDASKVETPGHWGFIKGPGLLYAPDGWCSDGAEPDWGSDDEDKGNHAYGSDDDSYDEQESDYDSGSGDRFEEEEEEDYDGSGEGEGHDWWQYDSDESPDDEEEDDEGPAQKRLT